MPYEITLNHNSIDNILWSTNIRRNMSDASAANLNHEGDMNTVKIYRFKKGDMPANYQTLETKQNLPAEPDVIIKGKLDGNFVEIFSITERIAGDTVYNERREVVGAYVQIPDPYKSGYYNVSRLDKNQAAKLFSYYDSWGNTQDD